MCNAGIVRTKVEEEECLCAVCVSVRHAHHAPVNCQYFADYVDEDWHKLMAVHLHGSYNCVRAAWPHFRAQKYGRIVLTSSSAGLYGQNLQSGYGAAKAVSAEK